MTSSLRHSISALGTIGVGLLAAPMALATGILSGTVSFDTSTDLYTYSYVLQNLGGHGRINQFYIAVNSIGPSNIGPTSFSSSLWCKSSQNMRHLKCSEHL